MCMLQNVLQRFIEVPHTGKKLLVLESNQMSDKEPSETTQIDKQLVKEVQRERSSNISLVCSEYRTFCAIFKESDAGTQ